MNFRSLLSSMLIGAVASARSMTPMATIAMARLAHRKTPGELFLLDRPLFKYGALAMGAGELAGDKMKTRPHRVPGAAVARDERRDRRRRAGAAGKGESGRRGRGGDRRAAGLCDAGGAQGGHGADRPDQERIDRGCADRGGGGGDRCAVDAPGIPVDPPYDRTVPAPATSACAYTPKSSSPRLMMVTSAGSGASW